MKMLSFLLHKRIYSQKYELFVNISICVKFRTTDYETYMTWCFRIYKTKKHFLFSLVLKVIAFHKFRILSLILPKNRGGACA